MYKTLTRMFTHIRHIHHTMWTSTMWSVFLATQLRHTSQLRQHNALINQITRCFPPHATPRYFTTEISHPQYQKHVLYKAKWIKPFRILVRAKIFQLGAVAALAVPINTMCTQGSVTATDLMIAAALVGGCAVAGTVCLSWWGDGVHGCIYVWSAHWT